MRFGKVVFIGFYWMGEDLNYCFLYSWGHLRGFFDDTVMWWVGGFCHPGECLRGHRTEALVSRVWIFTPRHDSHTFGANLRHRHRHTCHRHLRSSWWERHWVNENVMKIWKRWREGMINLINYPFYFGRRGKKSHAVSVHWYCLLWWQTALPPQTFHCHRHHYHHHHYW